MYLLKLRKQILTYIDQSQPKYLLYPTEGLNSYMKLASLPAARHHWLHHIAKLLEKAIQNHKYVKYKNVKYKI